MRKYFEENIILASDYENKPFSLNPFSTGLKASVSGAVIYLCTDDVVVAKFLSFDGKIASFAIHGNSAYALFPSALNAHCLKCSFDVVSPDILAIGSRILWHLEKARWSLLIIESCDHKLFLRHLVWIYVYYLVWFASVFWGEFILIGRHRGKWLGRWHVFFFTEFDWGSLLVRFDWLELCLLNCRQVHGHLCEPVVVRCWKICTLLTDIEIRFERFFIMC